MKRNKWMGMIGVVLLAFNAQAMLDMNGNGISDVYERHYGLTGQEGAGSDLDGDGWTLEQECWLGTDPTTPDPSPILLNQFTVSATNGQVVYEFMAHAGLRYGVEYADDLSSVSNGWTLGTEILGDETLHSYGDSATNSLRFYRLTALGPDADADGDLLDSREEVLAGTNPNWPDSDGDGLPDGYEAASILHDPSTNGNYVLASLDYRETFESFNEGLLNGQNGWLVSADKQALIQSGTPFSGLKGVQLTALTKGVVAEKYFDGAAVSNVWIDFQLLPGATVENPVPSVLGTVAATAIYFTGDGHLKAFDGTSKQWVEDGFASGGDVLEWRRLTFYLDYPNQRWLVYVNGSLVNPAPGGVPTWFGFSNPSPFFFRLAFEVQGNGNEVYLDDIVVSTSQPSDLDFNP